MQQKAGEAVIGKLRVFRCGEESRVIVLLDEAVDAARAVQHSGVVFQDRQSDVWLAWMAQRGVIRATKWVVDADRGGIDWHWDHIVSHGLRELIDAIDTAA